MIQSTREAAALLGLHVTSIRRWVRLGDLPAPPWDEATLRALAAAKRSRSAVAVAEDHVPEALTPDQIRGIRADYSDWLGGSPMTVNAICAKYGITRRQFADLRNVEGFVHASEPVPVSDLFALPEDEIVENSLDIARSNLAHRYEKSRWKDVQDAAAKWHNRERVMAELAEAFAAGVGRYVPRVPDTDEHDEAVGLLRPDNDLMLIVHPTDLHYGKRGTSLVGPGRYDRETARKRLFESFAEVWSMLPCYPERVALFVGSDGCHIDSAKGTTTKGTPQDLDGTPYEIAVEYSDLMHDAVEWFRRRGPYVDVRVCPGNHDKFVSRLVHAGIKRTYANDPSVTVWPSMAEYQAFVWGQCSVMTTHGDGRCSTTDLAQVFATQFPREWGGAKHRLVLRGNLHHTHDEEGAGIRNILLPSLSGSDEYHQIKWPVSGTPTLRAPLLHKTKGIMAIYEACAE